jgi:hypothetical protein
MEYMHTQRAPLGWILYLTGIGMVGVSWFLRGEPVAAIILGSTGVVVVLVGTMFGYLKVWDAGDGLIARYGPLPVFYTKIAYADITAVEPDRSSVIDGWGVHYMPGRGWTYNLWGLDCVKITRGGRITRIGTDDRENLAAFVRSKIGAPG